MGFVFNLTGARLFEYCDFLYGDDKVFFCEDRFGGMYTNGSFFFTAVMDKYVRHVVIRQY